MRFSPDVFPQGEQPSPDVFPQGEQPSPPQPQGHAHFWERALTRRRMLVAGAGGVAAAAVLGATHLSSGLTHAAAPVPAAPRPIPETIPGTPFHILFPGQGEPI